MPRLEFDHTQKTILAVVAHADDADFWFGGTLAELADTGAEVYILILTNGDKGSSDPNMSPHKLTAIRVREQEQAAKALGAKQVFFAGYSDCELEYSRRDATRTVVEHIRRIKPDLVIGWDPTFVYSSKYQLVNHLDHRAAGLATVDAVYPLARDLTYPELGSPHIVRTLLLINPDQADHFVDIEEYLDAKLTALGFYASQTGLASEKTTLDQLHASGKPDGIAVAEGFVRIELSPQ